jgi:hypothetical protein
MADNITAPAAGTNFATDEIGGIHHPRTKVGFGADGAYADVSTDNPFPVAIVSGGGSGGGTVGGATETTLAGLSGKLPASLGPKAASTSLSIVPATSSDMATNAGFGAALAAVSFYPATQPVSGNVGVTGSVAVTGQFFQATQPVSIAAPVAVTGTFFQATQPISAASLPLPAGAATQATLAALLAVGTETYTLAGNITLAAAAAGPTVTVPRGGYFFFDAAFSGTSPSLKLQRLGSDGTTWMDVVTRTATGTGDPVGIPNGSQLRVYNAGSVALTNVSAVLG